MRVVIELRRGENAEVRSTILSAHQLQTSFSMNMVALDGGQPQDPGLKALLEIFLRHRREVVTRRTQFRCARRASARMCWKLVGGPGQFDEIIALIRHSPARPKRRPD